ncbi:MAG: dolichyl-diphosphooligosaccharide--protein glycosyltransferase subunit 1 [Pycnora praestabilis]|nr:MAG: dolichyl-diphosphooligosaccharide--protein glycosyltransferase subunit 1 [Pycnora praestabilis]
MKSLTSGAILLSLLSTGLCASDSNLTTPLSSRQILPSNFKPPQVFQNVNLLRNINLEKNYVREVVNVVIENIDSKPQDEYYVPFEAELVERIGSFEVRDKKEPERSVFSSETVEYDTYSTTQFYRVRLPQPLQPSTQQTLSISYFILSALTPLPAIINQMDQQYVKYTFSTYSPSAYSTLKQKTKLKFPTTNIPEYTILPDYHNSEGKEDPQRQGSAFTYGPYSLVPPGISEPISVRYEFTRPLTHATLLERDIEVSHWGGNLATEERYWLTNNGAKLAKHFSRVDWTRIQHSNLPTSALKELRMPLKVGSLNPYFTDDIGNVSTSRFRSNMREANLELKPRYPVFGGWKYSFRVGWDADLKSFLRKLSSGTSYVLKVPFLEGPKQQEGIEYERVEVRVILPEGATNINYTTPIPILTSTTSSHRTFMDTLGRSTLRLTALNVVDDARDKDLIVTYDYPLTAGLRKPITIFLGVLSVFVMAWGIGRLDVSIGKT